MYSLGLTNSVVARLLKQWSIIPLGVGWVSAHPSWPILGYATCAYYCKYGYTVKPHYNVAIQGTKITGQGYAI